MPDRAELLNNIFKKIEYIDTCLHNGRGIGNMDISKEAWEAPAQINIMLSILSCLRACQGWPLLLRPDCSVWQDTLTSLRAKAASLGLWLRPRIFGPPAGTPAPAEERPGNATAEAAASDSSCSPGQDYNKFETLYLSSNRAVKGVLQLHKALTSGKLVFAPQQTMMTLNQAFMLKPTCTG